MAVISFDFDDTLVTREPPQATRHLNPAPGLERPVERILAIMQASYLAGHSVVIVTARWKPLNPQRQSPPTIQWWLRQWEMPDVAVHYTNNALKGPLLKALGVTLHYDDCPMQIKSAREYGINVMVVEPEDRE